MYLKIYPSIYLSFYQGSVDIINSTLGKALGGAAGGYTTASKPLIDLLRQRSRYNHPSQLP